MTPVTRYSHHGCSQIPSPSSTSTLSAKAPPISSGAALSYSAVIL